MLAITLWLLAGITIAIGAMTLWALGQVEQARTDRERLEDEIAVRGTRDTLLRQVQGQDQGQVRLRDYELFKALHGHTTHEAEVELPVVPNAQDMDVLTASVDKVLTRMDSWGYLIAGHGLYAWGRDINEARRHLEAFEFMLACDLELRKLQR